jgi:plastocyanin
MRLRGGYLFTLCCALAATAAAAEVSGKITIEKGIIKKPVSATVYELRGPSVSEESPARRDQSEFEKIAVWLDSAVATSVSPSVATLQQRNKQFEPSLLIVPVGSTVDFPNLDPVFHNIFSLSRTQSFDLGYYPKGHSRSVKFPNAGIVQVYCHVHPEMHGVIIVAATPWYGKPDNQGNFSWPQIPAGRYKLGVWQTSVGVLHRTVVVSEGAHVHVELSLPHSDSED